MDNYYSARSARLLRQFDRALKTVRPVFRTGFGKELTREMTRQARHEFKLLLPQLPYIGGKQPFTQFIISSAWFLAMYRVIKRFGVTSEEAGQLVYDASKLYVEATPGFVRRLFGYMTFSRSYQRAVQKRALESQDRRYPGDYIYVFVPGDGIEFDYGVDYLECATCKFFASQGEPELARYLCAVDDIYSQKLGWGLERTMTIAEGFEICDFRFKKGRPTRVALPGTLKRA